MVINGDSTPREVVRRASRQIDRVGGKILGAVINNVDLKKSDFGSYYHSHNDYQDYYGQEETVNP